jgi:hypothetical protein
MYTEWFCWDSNPRRTAHGSLGSAVYYVRKYSGPSAVLLDAAVCKQKCVVQNLAALEHSNGIKWNADYVIRFRYHEVGNQSISIN